MASLLFLQIIMEVTVNNDGQMMKQGVTLQYRDNYLKINTPAMEKSTTPAIFIHDTAEV